VEARRDLAREPDGDRIEDECGVFGIHGHPEAAKITYLGLYALQHRGQESAGICTTQGGEHFVHRAMGLVSDVFKPSPSVRTRTLAPSPSPTTETW
jgi:amidophosphoribosyltransferase